MKCSTPVPGFANLECRFIGPDKLKNIIENLLEAEVDRQDKNADTKYSGDSLASYELFIVNCARILKLNCASLAESLSAGPLKKQWDVVSNIGFSGMIEGVRRSSRNADFQESILNRAKRLCKDASTDVQERIRILAAWMPLSIARPQGEVSSADVSRKSEATSPRQRDLEFRYVSAFQELQGFLLGKLRILIPDQVGMAAALNRRIPNELELGVPAAASQFAFMLVLLSTPIARSEGGVSSLNALRNLASKQFILGNLQDAEAVGDLDKDSRTTFERAARREFSLCEIAVELTEKQIQRKIAYPLDPIFRIVEKQLPLAGSDTPQGRDLFYSAVARKVLLGRA